MQAPQFHPGKAPGAKLGSKARLGCSRDGHGDGGEDEVGDGDDDEVGHWDGGWRWVWG